MQGGDAIGGGIIPARAGFTQGRLDWRPLPRDHPRSRGVYPRPRWGGLRKSGSSPLARGLPDGVVVQGGPEGIIPARAGFTSRWSDAVRRRPDHPRSRGVYSVSFDSVIVLTGSSPLARGLRRQRSSPECGKGIIPARAGFTSHENLGGLPDADHPRSRGVYLRPMPVRTWQWGSSPLARGLPSASAACDSDRADHPRSRGVYADGGEGRKVDVGSSPLARGLQSAD